MRTARTLPPAFENRCFTIDQARDLGVGPGRLRGRDLVSPSRSLRWSSTTPPSALDVARGLLALHPDAVISHQTAAQWWQLPFPARLREDDTVHLTVPVRGGVGSHVRRRGVVSHRAALSEDDVWPLGCWNVTSVERTYLDLAPVLTEDELVDLGDAIVCAHEDDRQSSRGTLSTVTRLSERCAGSHGRGVRRARAALGLVRVGSDSVPETRLRLALVRAGLPEPELNVVIAAPGRSRRVFPDLAYRRHRVSVQYDGAHHADARQHRLDIERADLTAAAGWVEVRISADDLRILVAHRSGRAPRAVMKVEAALRARAAHSR